MAIVEAPIIKILYLYLDKLEKLTEEERRIITQVIEALNKHTHTVTP